MYKKNSTKLLVFALILFLSSNLLAQDYGRNNQFTGQFNYQTPANDPSIANPNYGQNYPRSVNLANPSMGYKPVDDSYYNMYQSRVNRIDTQYENQFKWLRPPVSLNMDLPKNAQLYFENYNNSPSPGNTNAYGEVLVYGKPAFPDVNRPQAPISFGEKLDYSKYGSFGAPAMFAEYPMQPAQSLGGGYLQPNMMPRSVFPDGINNVVLAGAFTHTDDHDYGEDLYDVIEKKEKKFSIEHGRKPTLTTVKGFIKENEKRRDIASLGGNPTGTSTGNQPIAGITANNASNPNNLPNVNSAVQGISSQIDNRPGDTFQGKTGVYVDEERGALKPSVEEENANKEDPEITKRRNLADEMTKNGDLHEAILAYQAFLLDYPDDKPALLGIAKAYQKNQQFKASRDVYVKLISLEPANATAMNNLILLISEQHPSIALQQLFELEKSNSSYAPIPAQIATVYMQNAEFAEAVKSLKRALDLDPRNTRYKFAIAICYEYLNFNQEALAIYKDLYSSIKKKGLVFDDKKVIEERIYLLSKYLEQNQA